MTESVTSKTVVLASTDAALRQRLRVSLTSMRWQVREAGGGAEAMAQLEDARPEALLMDYWLPDLEASEFAGNIVMLYPDVDVLRMDGDPVPGGTRSPRRNELLHALREAVNDVHAAVAAKAQPAAAAGDGVAWAAAPVAVPQSRFLQPGAVPDADTGASLAELEAAAARSLIRKSAESAHGVVAAEESAPAQRRETSAHEESVASAAVRQNAAGPLPVTIAEMIGRSPAMLELAGLIRVVAPRSATVLIEGETGSGKEVVAQALHRLSERAQKPFAVLNCAAIPESLLEAELFGHTRGAFTGAVQSRTGRIEAADGGTLFLDEIGEMPLALQAKMLRFLECGELQRVGDNEVIHVNVRVIAATHQHLEKRAAEGTFRLDLYHRLAVFPVEVPPLRERTEDLAELAEFFLAKLGEEAPRKRLSAAALARLREHSWPGNVRELAHVLERASILVGERPEIGVEEIRFKRATL